MALFKPELIVNWGIKLVSVGTPGTTGYLEIWAGRDSAGDLYFVTNAFFEEDDEHNFFIYMHAKPAPIQGFQEPGVPSSMNTFFVNQGVLGIKFTDKLTATNVSWGSSSQEYIFINGSNTADETVSWEQFKDVSAYTGAADFPQEPQLLNNPSVINTWGTLLVDAAYNSDYDFEIWAGRNKAGYLVFVIDGYNAYDGGEIYKLQLSSMPSSFSDYLAGPPSEYIQTNSSDIWTLSYEDISGDIYTTVKGYAIGNSETLSWAQYHDISGFPSPEDFPMEGDTTPAVVATPLTAGYKMFGDNTGTHNSNSIGNNMIEESDIASVPSGTKFSDLISNVTTSKLTGDATPTKFSDFLGYPDS